MPKTPDCDRCQFYAHGPNLVCAVYPTGVEGKCLDFRQHPSSQVGEEKQWSPEGYYWWDGELLPNRPVTLTSGEQLAILDSHPVFTGVFPKCCYHFDESNLPLIYLNCCACSWSDNSV